MASKDKEVAIEDLMMKMAKTTLPGILLRILVAIAASMALVGYCYAAFYGFPGQTYPFIIGTVAIIAWRIGGLTAGATLAITILGIDWFVLEGDGLAISKPEQAAGVTVLLCVGTVLIWTIRSAGRERDAMRARINELENGYGIRKGMLDELVHRIRNDLTAMSSLAALYGRPGANHSAGLKAISERISVLGRLYQRLHVSDGDPAQVEMSVFLHEIVEDLKATHLGIRPISIDARIVSVVLPMQTASVVGLVLNEAVTNALKYAFPNDMEGSIHADLSQCEEGMRLEVEDNGVGPGDETPKGTGLGSRLMKAMAAQIGGRYVFERIDGRSVARLTFPTA